MNKSSSSSKPLSPAQRTDLYNAGMSNIFGSFGGTPVYREVQQPVVQQPQQQEPIYASGDRMGGFFNRQPEVPQTTAQSVYSATPQQGIQPNFPQYQAPNYQYTSPYQSLSGGDYEALQNSLYTGATAGLRQYENEARDNIDQSLANRGIWSSGIAQAAQNDITDSLADTYSQAGAAATAQRYGLQAQELAQQNAFNQAESQFGNQFNMTNAGLNYQSQWAPLEFLAQLWNGTNGIASKSSSFGIQSPVSLAVGL